MCRAGPRAIACKVGRARKRSGALAEADRSNPLRIAPSWPLCGRHSTTRYAGRVLLSESIAPRALGADAVLGMHALPASSDSHPRWVSGVAVRWLDHGAGGASRRAGFVVAVLPIEIPDALVQKAKERARLADALCDEARSMLETRGY